MSKKQLILTIEEDVVDKAKKQIPNISAFVEQCIRNYLGIGNGLVNTSNIHDLNETISKCQLELYLMNERGNIKEAQEKAEKQEINFAWRHLYTEYRDTQTINPEKLKHASDVLGVDEECLTDILDVLTVFQNENNIDVTEWEEVYREYGGDSK